MDDTVWSLIDFGDSKKAGGASVPPVVRGVCKRCGKHIGKGVHFHEKTCEGVNA